MKKIIYATSFLTMAVLNLFGSNGFTGNLMFTATLNGSQETPSVTTNAIGVASFSLNNTHDTLCIKVSTKGLSGAITGAHIHQGNMGIAGSVVFPLTPYVSGDNITTMLTGSDLTPAVISSFMNEMYYINVHTAAQPNGEIRGQILLETDNQYSADLTGSQETPAVSTNAQGLAACSLSKIDSIFSVMAIVHGLSGPIISAHLHRGAPGVSGPVVADLSSGINGTMISLDVNPTAFLSDLLAGNIYINVHTSANPDGEIRGQLMTDMKLNFDVFLDGFSETPATSSFAKGTGTIKINSMMDTLWYNILYDGLSAVPTSAHFHEGAAGVAGPPVINISSGILNNHRISGMVTGGALTLNFINKLMEGDIYINAHSPLYPNGEIRGQVDRLTREGFTYEIDGSQETPSTSSTATGSGFASIDREKENLHFMMVVNGLTGPITASHFHQASVGISGPPIFEITSFFSQTSTNDVASGFWTVDNVPDFSTTVADIFLHNQIYVNIHTTSFPNGEIRGQVMQGSSCFTTQTSVTENETQIENLTLFPNPASNTLFLTFNAKEKDDVVVIISDILGRQVIVKNTCVTNGENKISVDIESLQSGIYNLQICLPDKKMLISKFMK